MMVIKKEKIRKFLNFETMPRLEILVAAILIFTIIIYPTLGKDKNVYYLGEIAAQNVKATQDFLVEDQGVTEARRNAAEEAVKPVYDYDSVSATNTVVTVRKAFMEARVMQEQARLSTLFSSNPENTGYVTIKPQDSVGATNGVDSLSHAEVPPPPGQAAAPVAMATPTDIRQKFDQTVDAVMIKEATLLVLEADGYAEKTENAVCETLTEISHMTIVSNIEVFMREAMRGITLRNIKTQNEQALTDFKDFKDVNQIKEAAAEALAEKLKGADQKLIGAATDLVQQLIKPNITLNNNETLTRKSAARTNIKPVLYQIKAGEMLLREGEPITQTQLLKLNAMGEQSTPLAKLSNSLGMAALVFMLLISAYYIFLRKRLRRDANVNRQILFMTTIFVAFFILTQAAWVISEVLAKTGYEIAARNFFYCLPLAAAPMIVCQFLNWRAAAPFAIISAASFALVFDNNMSVFVFFFITGTIAAYFIYGNYDRKNFAVISIKIALLNILMVLILALYNADFSPGSIGISLILALVNGILTPMVTMGITPLIEFTFGYNTNMTMLELSNLDRPLLKRLILEAPGTYHHSILVGSLAESAASEIGANPLVAKVGGYYHDIGKLNKPTYFIENISRSQNKHDKLSPSMSSLILQAHVKDGVEMAKEYKVGKAIEDIIKQHHGTSIIRYFFEKAKSLRTCDMPEVNIEDYRYPGPKPQSKEAALVMLADVIEASSRALQNPTSARLKGLVQKMINEIFADGQLSDCDLTLRDLHKIANNFHKMLCGIHHSRIEYPENNGNKDKGTVKNGNTDGKPANSTHPDRNAYAGSGNQLIGFGDGE